jgi:hypothetical protein
MLQSQTMNLARLHVAPRPKRAMMELRKITPSALVLLPTPNKIARIQRAVVPFELIAGHGFPHPSRQIRFNVYL